MGKIRTASLVKPFVGILCSIPDLLGEVENHLEPLLGPIDLRSEAFSFDATHYYDDEMGSPLERRFLLFNRLIRAENIAAIKTATNQLEAVLAGKTSKVKRPVNLDPGYLELAKIVLASTKNFYHRILIADGIYAEVTQHYESQEWRSFPWTFPDFREGRYNAFFSDARTIYREQLKSLERRL